MSTVYSTNFDSDTPGNLPANWVNKNGASWTVQAVNPVSGANAFRGTTDAHFVECQAAGTLLTDSEITFQTLYPAGTFTPQGPALRMNDAFTTGYIVICSTAFVNATAVGQVWLFKKGAGTNWSAVSTAQSITVAGSPVTGDTINVALKIVGSTIEYAIWKDGTAKPTSGTGFKTWTDSSHTGAGYPGLYNTTTGGTYVDNFSEDDLASATYGITGPSGGVAGVASTNFTLSVTGTITSTIFTPSDGGGGGTFTPATLTLSGASPSGTFTYTPASAGAKTISCTNDGGLTNPGNLTYTATGTATSYTLTGPSGGSVGAQSTNFTITISGTTIGSTIFTPSDSGDGGAFSPTTVTITASTNGSGTFTYTPASAGAKSISTSDNGGLTDPSPITYTATSGSVSIAVSDSNIVWAPGAWDEIAVSTYGVSVLSKQTANAGAYLKFRVTGSTDVSLVIDSSISTAISAGSRPSITYSVNGGPRVTVLIAAQSSIALLSGGASGDRIFEVFGMFVENSGGTRFSLSAGVSLTNGIRIQGLTLNAGAAMATFPNIKTNKLIVWGDSITEGVFAGTGWNNTSAVITNNDPLSTFVPVLAQALDSEYAQIGFGAQGWGTTGSAGAVFGSTYAKFSTDRNRDLTQYDYAVVLQGTNDGLSYAGSATIQAWISDCRTAMGPGKWIFVATPPGGYAKSALDTATSAYIAANPSDTHVKRIDFSDVLNTKYFSTGASLYTADTYHPNAYGHGQIGGALASKINAFIGGGGVTPVPDPLWDSVIEGTLTAQEVLRLILSVLAGETTITGSTVTFKSQDGLTDRVTAIMTGSERTSITVDGA